MNRVFWAGVALQAVSLTAILMTANPWTLVSGSVGLILLTLGMYQGTQGRRTWADMAVVVVALAAVVGTFVQVGLAYNTGTLALTGLLAANLAMAAICAALLVHWLSATLMRQNEREPSAAPRSQQPLAH